jgi:arylsulfatase A-like enzyme
MLRREFLAVAAATGLALADDKRPNILLILVDDLGFADLGCYGSSEIRTPAIDGLAKDGVRFSRGYSSAPVCSPTRAALMTGRYPHRMGIEYVFYLKRTADKGLSAEEPTLPRLLKAAGYRTGMAGKWHLGNQDQFSPNAHGFEEFFGFRDSDHDYYTHRNVDGTPDLFENNQPVEKPGYSTDLFGEWCSRFVREARDRPFFLYAAFNAPHWPFQPPDKPEDVRSQGNWQAGTRGDYVRMVESLDANVGRILAALKESGAAENTLVIFTNDNGGDRLSDNGPAFHHKFTLWEGGIRVPLILRWPGRLPRGTECNQVAITMDLTATVLDAAGVAPRADRPLEGISLLPVASGAGEAQPRRLFWRHRGQTKAVRDGDWKLVHDQGYDLLFDLSADPGEREDRALQEPERLARLQTLLKEWEAEMEAAAPPWRVA